MVTKSGGDAWHGRGTGTWLGDATQTQNIDDNLLRYGFRPETNSVDFTSDINVSGGGPIIAKKLRMFASFRDWRVHVNTPAAFSTLVLDKTDITPASSTPTTVINYEPPDRNLRARHYKRPNRFPDASNVSVLESTNNEDYVFDIYQYCGTRSCRKVLHRRVG